MATVTRENIGLLNEKLIVKVAKDDYLPSFEKAIKSYSKQANIPGFRKGMVPVGMVKKMYGSSVFADEVIKSVEKGLSDYMTNEKLEIFAQPLPLPENDASRLDMNQPTEYAFSFEVGLKPEFSLSDLSQAHLSLYKITVTDEMVNEQVDRMLASHGKPLELESVTSDQNDLTVTFTESNAEGEELENSSPKELRLKLSEFTPDYRGQLTGKTKGESVVLQLANAFDEKERAVVLQELGVSTEDAGALDKFYKLVIKNIELVEKPVLNEDFFKQVYPANENMTEAEFREQVKSEIQAQWDAQSRGQLSDQVYHELLEHTNIEFPADFLKRWLQTSSEKQKTPEEVEKEFPTFVNQLKWTLIVDKIVEQNHIDVKPDEIREFAKRQLLGYMGGTNIDIDQPWVNDYVERMMKDKKFVEDSFHRIRTEKVFSWAEAQVHPSEVPITLEDFTKMTEAHHHHH